jgi:hypothetical protein
MNLEERNSEYAAEISKLTDEHFEVMAAVRNLNVAALARMPSVALIGDFSTLLAFAIRRLPTQSLRDAVIETAVSQIRNAASLPASSAELN